MSDAPPVTGMAWIAGGHVPDGLGRALPGGGTRAPGRGRRVLDRSPPGDQPPTSPPSWRRPATSRSPSARSIRGLFPGAPTENLAARLARVHAGPAGPSTCATSPSGGPGRPARAGVIPRARARRSTGRDDHPVVHVAYEDAKRYATWAGRALPTEAQWELAARGGLDGATYTWGDAPEPRGGRARELLARRLPLAARAGLRDDHAGRLVPAQRLRALRHGRQRVGVDGGLVRAPPSRRRLLRSAGPARRRRRGSLDPAQPQFAVPRKVVKGGSFLCADSYCLRYRPAARRPQMIDTGMSHVGFRCVRTPGQVGDR